MRVLYFADIRFPLERANGIQTMETCYALAERGHRVHLVVKGDTQAPARDPFAFYGLAPTPNLVIERANAPSLRASTSALRAAGDTSRFGWQAAGAGILARVGYLSFVLGRAFGKTRADVIMTRDLGVASALLTLPASAKATAGLRPPITFESHGYAPEVAAALPELVATASAPSESKLRRLAAREARVWNGAEGYVTITQALADDLSARFGPRPHLTVVPDGMRLPATAPSPLPDDRVVGYAGHLYAWKGVDVLLQALARVPDARGLIVGGHEKEPDLERVKTLAEGLGIADRVTFTGLVEPSKVAEQLARATILVLPNPASAISTRFTSPLKLFEYMAAGRAIVASDLPSIREVVRDNEQALLVEPGNAEAVASAIRRLLADRDLAARLARAAFAEAPKYTWARRAEKIEALFTALVSDASH
jgi:glycosyltransferase involved in cell wall biosynthesis